MNSVGERRNEMKCDGEAIDRRLSGDIARLHSTAFVSQDNIRVMYFHRKIKKSNTIGIIPGVYITRLLHCFESSD